MAFLGVGKKAAPKSAPVATDELRDETDDASVGAVAAAPAAKKGLFGKGAAKKSAAAKAPPKAKVRRPGGDLDIYTAVLAAAVVALAAGCVLIAMDNLGGVQGTSDEGNPFALVSSN